MRLSAAQARLLRSMADGAALKSHRNLDGEKEYRLHALDGSSVAVHRSTIEALSRRGLIGSNQKFPVATYWLTDRGRYAIDAVDRSGRA